MLFPDIITPMKNGKFIFFSEKTWRYDFNYSTYEFFDLIEIWEMNDTLSQSVMVLPLNLTHDFDYLWIFPF